MSYQLLDTTNRPYDISIVVPFLNERENLPQLYDEVCAVLKPLQKSFEVIFVDDGSTDGSTEWIAQLAAKENYVKLVQFTRNFGQTAAMSAGFELAQGRIYIAMDADNQNDPADIPAMLQKLEEGFDVVSGWRKHRKDRAITRKLPSKIANWIISRFTGVHLHDYGCSLKAYRAEYVDMFHLYGEMHRFIPAYASMVGAKVVELPVNHRARTRGASKYGLTRIFKVVMDLMTVNFLLRYSTKPSYLFGGAGILLCIGGMLAALEVLVEKYWFGTFAHNNPFLLLAVFLFSLGVQLLLMGLLAEVIVRTYHESQRKPIYIVKRTLNVSPSDKRVPHVWN